MTVLEILIEPQALIVIKPFPSILTFILSRRLVIELEDDVADASQARCAIVFTFGSIALVPISFAIVCATASFCTEAASVERSDFALVVN